MNYKSNNVFICIAYWKYKNAVFQIKDRFQLDNKNKTFQSYQESQEVVRLKNWPIIQ